MKNVECRMACAVGILASSFCLEPAGNAAGTVASTGTIVQKYKEKMFFASKWERKKVHRLFVDVP